MRQLYAAEVRGAWQAWLGVALTFVAVNVATAMGGLFVSTGLRALSSGIEGGGGIAAALFVLGGFALMGALFAGGSVIGTSTGLVVDSRRGAYARLALAGATPGQLVRVVLAQLVVVTLACAVVGDLVAALAFPPFLGAVLSRGEDNPGVAVGWAWWVFVGANLLSVLAAVIGGRRQARAASRIPALEALRPVREESLPARRRSRVWRWIVVVLCGVTLFASVGGVLALAREMGTDAALAGLFVGLVGLFLTGFIFQAGGPVVMRGLTLAWTAVVPASHPTWFLARQTVLVKADRLIRSLTPMMYAVALMFGMLGINDSFNAALAARYPGEVAEPGGDAWTVMLFAGAPLLITLAGAIGSLVMMARQRDAELALAGIVGATPRQRVLLPVFEALILTTTAVLLGLVMSAVALGTFMGTIWLKTPDAAVRLPIATLAGTALVCLLISVAATLGPSLASLRRPAPEVVARLVAD